MRIVSVSISGFRGYRDTVTVQFDSITALVGKNDVGKSTILEALDIFFNDGKTSGKLERADINVSYLAEGHDEIVISVVFSDLPDKIVIDSTVQTSLQAEYMLNKDGNLEIVKRYRNASSPKVFIRALHPTNPVCSDLLIKRNSDLRRILTENSIECANLVVNATMRAAIWHHCANDLRMQEVEIDTSKEDAKEIWSRIIPILPVYTLFQSDRKNSDGDSEIQDPLQAAVREIIADQSIQETLLGVSNRIIAHLQEVSERTLQKLQEIDPSIACSISPEILSPEKLKWAEVFRSVSITGDESIPINKRGSGVKRVILLSFFRAEAERRTKGNYGNGIIYAIEEPETSQHSANQKLLIDAFIKLASTRGTQVILTTHSPIVVKKLDYPNLRLVVDVSPGMKRIQTIEGGLLGYTSLNEINYRAFGEITEEFHNELYGYIEMQGWLAEFKTGKRTHQYIQVNPQNLSTRVRQLTMTEIIRHQIHHPENTHNPRFSEDELCKSIQLMIHFIETHKG